VKGLPTQLPAQEPPGVLPKQEPKPAATPASAPASSPVSSPAASTPPPPPPQAAPPAAPPAVDVAAPRPDEKLKAAEVALQRGDTAAAIDRLKPLADAGVVHAQGLLGRAYERISGRMPSSLAYMWYSLAARHGEPGAAADRDRMAARLHDDEIAQANRQIEHFLKLHALPASGAPR
jgi:TPR repeat protein